MKKAFYYLVGAVALALPSVAMAQGGGITPTVQPTSLPGTADFGALLTSVINWFLTLVGLIAVIMLIIGGFRYLTSGGNQEAVEKAKNTILYAIIGIVIVILSYAIVATITGALGSL